MNGKYNKDHPMFFKLERDRNYAYIFFIIVGLTLLSSFLFGEKIAGVLFFLSFYYLGALQLHSGLAFGRSWTAKYRKNKDASKFNTIITLCFLMGTFGLIMLLFYQP